MTDRPQTGPDAVAKDSRSHAAPSSSKPALPPPSELAQKLFWSVPEAAFMTGVSARTVWRLMADPQSGFPRPRRVRGRTLLVASEVMEFMQEGASP